MLQRQPAFVGRVHELAVLQDVAERDSGALVLVSGRRRIGKTYLLQHFIHNRRAIFYQATRQAPNVELTAFTREVERALGTFPPGYSYPTWDAAFDDLTARCDEKRLVVVLDEFSYLCDSNPGMPSIVQRWWDLRGRNSSIMLVLCGSSQSFMADLDNGSAPLHQRFTAKIRLGPLTFREAALFVPTLTPADRARVYGVLGGTPLYLREWNAARPVRENLIRLFGDPAGLLVDSARLVLHTDLGDATAAYRALSAVAAGATRRNDPTEGKHHERARFAPTRRAVGSDATGPGHRGQRLSARRLCGNGPVLSFLVSFHRAASGRDRSRVRRTSDR